MDQRNDKIDMQIPEGAYSNGSIVYNLFDLMTYGK